MVVGEGPLAEAAWHVWCSPQRRRLPRRRMIIGVGGLVLVPGAALGLAVGVGRVAAAGSPALTTAVRVVDRVHHDAADGRAHALPAAAAGLADVDDVVLGVADLRRRWRGSPPAPAGSRRRAAAARPSCPPWPGAGPVSRRSGPSWRRRRGAARSACTSVPTGMLRSGSALPGLMSAFSPDSRTSPTFRPGRGQDVALLAVEVVQPRDAGDCGWGRTRSRRPWQARRPSCAGSRSPGSFCLCPPPWWRVVMRPWALRPAFLGLGLVRDLSGLSVVTLAKSDTLMPRRAGVVGLYLRTAMVRCPWRRCRSRRPRRG